MTSEGTSDHHSSRPETLPLRVRHKHDQNLLFRFSYRTLWEDLGPNTTNVPRRKYPSPGVLFVSLLPPPLGPWSCLESRGSLVGLTSRHSLLVRSPRKSRKPRLLIINDLWIGLVLRRDLCRIQWLIGANKVVLFITNFPVYFSFSPGFSDER